MTWICDEAKRDENIFRVYVIQFDRSWGNMAFALPKLMSSYELFNFLLGEIKLSFTAFLAHNMFIWGFWSVSRKSLVNWLRLMWHAFLRNSYQILFSFTANKVFCLFVAAFKWATKIFKYDESFKQTPNFIKVMQFSIIFGWQKYLYIQFWGF